MTFGEFRATCVDRLDINQERRPANALNVEYMTPASRCKQQSPDGRGSAWLLSGGSPLAYGTCYRSACPRLTDSPGAPAPMNTPRPMPEPAETIPTRVLRHSPGVARACDADPAAPAGTSRVQTSGMRFNGTIEILRGQHAAIITLTDERGEWSGSSRIDLPRGTNRGTNRDLYEAGYNRASQSAAVKGGSLETYKVVS